MDSSTLLKQIYSKVEELPTLPVVVPKLIQLIENPDSDTAQVTELIQNDAALTAKILKISNSAYYGFSQKISELDHAVSLLGFNMVKSLAVSIGVVNTFTAPEKKAFQDFNQDLWVHSLLVATIIQELGKRFAKKKKKEELFIIGLLHDTGKLVLEQFFPELFEKIFAEASEKQESFCLAENRHLGLDHAELGSLLLGRWKFPELIVETVAYHHKQEYSSKIDDIDIALLRAANHFAYLGDSENKSDFDTPPLLDSDKEKLGIDDKSLESMETFAIESQESVKSFYRALV